METRRRSGYGFERYRKNPVPLSSGVGSRYRYVVGMANPEANGDKVHIFRDRFANHIYLGRRACPSNLAQPDLNWDDKYHGANQRAYRSSHEGYERKNMVQRSRYEQERRRLSRLS